MEFRPTNLSTGTMDAVRRSSRSRSRTPAEFNGENLMETKSISRTTRIRSNLPAATSTPIDDVTDTSNNSSAAVTESYSKTVVNVVRSSKNTSVNDNNLKYQVNNTGSNTKTVRRSARPKVILSDQVTNGESTKIKEPAFSISKTTSSSSSVITNKRKAALVKEKLMQATKTSDYISNDGDEKNRTLDFYKKSGDWWDALPKTDYTYSPVSSYRREVAPGVNQLPNMSRRSLASIRGLSSPPIPTQTYSSNVTETYWSKTAANRRGHRMSDMSDTSDVDEVDYVTTRKVYQEAARRNVFSAFFMSVLTTITTVWTTMVERITEYRAVGGPTTPRRSTGAAAAVSRSTWWQRVTTWVYLSLAELDVLDSRILSWFRSSAGVANDEEKRRRLKYFFLFLVFFLLLPLAGFYLSQTYSSYYSLPFPAIELGPYVTSSITNAKAAVVNTSSSVYDFLVHFMATTWAGLLYAWSYLYVTFSYAFAVINEWFWYIALAVAHFFSHLPSTFIEFFAPLYNVFSPLFDLQLTLPNIF